MILSNSSIIIVYDIVDFVKFHVKTCLYVRIRTLQGLREVGRAADLDGLTISAPVLNVIA